MQEEKTKKEVLWLNDLIYIDIKWTDKNKFGTKLRAVFRYNIVNVTVIKNGKIHQQKLNFDNLIKHYYNLFSFKNNYSLYDFKIECYYIFLNFTENDYDTVDDFYYHLFISLRNKLKDLVKEHKKEFEKIKAIRQEALIIYENLYNDLMKTDNKFKEFYESNIEKILGEKEYKKYQQLLKIFNENGEITRKNISKFKSENEEIMARTSFYRLKHRVIEKVLVAFEKENRKILSEKEMIQTLYKNIFTDTQEKFLMNLVTFVRKNDSIYFLITDTLNKYENYDFEQYLTIKDYEMLQQTINKISLIVVKKYDNMEELNNE